MLLQTLKRGWEAASMWRNDEHLPFKTITLFSLLSKRKNELFLHLKDRLLKLLVLTMLLLSPENVVHTVQEISPCTCSSLAICWTLTIQLWTGCKELHPFDSNIFQCCKQLLSMGNRLHNMCRKGGKCDLAEFKRSGKSHHHGLYFHESFQIMFSSIICVSFTHATFVDNTNYLPQVQAFLHDDAILENRQR